MTVLVKRIELTGEDANKFYVLEGYVEGVPSVTKRATIMMSALVTRPSLLDDARNQLTADVTQYLANYNAIQGL